MTDEPLPSGESWWSRQLGQREVRWWIVVFASAFAASALVVGLHVQQYPKLSPIDELQHYDYLVKASKLQLVRNGERIGQQALREEACRGIDAAFTPPPCDTATFDPEVFQERGYNTASSQSPVYYTVSGLLARLLAAGAGLDSLLTAGRLVGAGWLAAGLITIVALARRLGASTFATALSAGVVLFSPVVLHAHATVNTDAVLLATGGGVVLAAFVAEERGGRWYGLPALAAFLAFVAEPTTIFATTVGAGYLALRVVGRKGLPPQNVLVAGAIAVLVLSGAFVGNEATGAFKTAIALDVGEIILPKDVQLAATDLTSQHVLTAIPALFTPLRDPYLPPFLDAPSIRAVVMLADLALVGLVIAAAVMSPRRSREGSLAASVLVTCLLAGPMLVLYNYETSSVYFPIPSRYGLSVVPVIAALASSSLRKRAANVAVALGLTTMGAFVLSSLV